MSDMRVKMILDLVANTKGGAAQAKRDFKDVKDAAKGLDGAQGGQKIARDILMLAPASKQATRSLRETKAAADSLGQSAGPTKLASNLARLRSDLRWMAAAKKTSETPRGSGDGTAAIAARAGSGVRSAVGGYLGARALTESVKRHAEAERAITRIGVTADASKEALADVGSTAFKIAQDVAMPYNKVVGGLDVLVAKGRSLKDAMAFLPSVARTASAAGAEVEDIANTADSVSANFKIASDQMQGAFDIMAAGGKAGQFELKDMARYLPSLAPSAAAAGFKGQEGLRDLVSMLQIVRKGTGSAEGAASSVENIFQKMETEETGKRFKKFGIDLAAGMAKGRKEGRNLVDVFEELTATALKGDLSKIPKLFQDQEFARGVRALMTYSGERQKMSKMIASSAAGSVAADLDKVTKDVQAKLDRLENVLVSRMRQIGAAISDVLMPIDKTIAEITAGKNPVANAIEERARLVNADTIAREEIKSGVEGSYDPKMRGIVDARKQLLLEQAIAERLAKLGQDIGTKEAELNAVSQRTQGAGKVRQDALLGPGRKNLEALRAEREELIALRKARDEANLAMVETEATAKRLNTRMSGQETEKPSPITPGLSSFGFGPYGSPTMAPLPPRRPKDLTKTDPMLNSFDDIYAAPGKSRAKAFVDLMTGADIDFGDLRTIAEMTTDQAAEGLRSGAPKVAAAAGELGDAAKSALNGMDGSAAGKQFGDTFASGMLASQGAVAAAARSLASTARNAAGNVTRRSLSGALHDGVE